MSLDRAWLAGRLSELSSQGIHLGTSSWKYPGWLGSLYSPERYFYRGKVAQTRFERDCLAEYAGVFPTVCVDAAYYDFPRPQYLQGLVAQVPASFRFTFKVTDAITIRKFPNLERFGIRAGKTNPDFLNADLFATAFLGPCEAIRSHVGMLIFEFSRFWPSDYAGGREFVAELDRFLGALPRGWLYGVEIRNRGWLQPDYFDCLSRHEVAHVFNSWEAMPPVGDQWELPGSLTHPRATAARLLLKPGRKYEEAVNAFQPYDRLREELPEVRSAAARLLRESMQQKRSAFVYVNNRLEGNALATIEAIVRMLAGAVS